MAEPWLKMRKGCLIFKTKGRWEGKGRAGMCECQQVLEPHLARSTSRPAGSEAGGHPCMWGDAGQTRDLWLTYNFH